MYNDANYSEWIIIGLLNELYEQYHKSVYAYKNAMKLKSDLFVKVSLGRAHVHISHLEKGMKILKSFTKQEFNLLKKKYHKSLIYSFLPYIHQLIILDNYSVNLSKQDSYFGLLSICEEDKILTDSLYNDNIQLAIVKLLKGEYDNRMDKTLFDHGIKSNIIERLKIEKNTNVRSMILTNIKKIEKEIFDEFDKLDGWLTPLEGRVLYYLAKISNENIVEIGSWKGKSSCFLAQGSLDGNKIKVICVDPHLWSDDVNKDNTFEFWNKIVKDFNFSKIVSNLRIKSKDIDPDFNKKIDLLFVDGDHTEEAVKMDVQLWTKFIIEGAYIVFHDSFLESVFKILQQFIWNNLNFIIFDVIEGMLIVRYLPNKNKKERNYNELVLWILLIYKKNSIRSYFNESEEEIKNIIRESFS